MLSLSPCLSTFVSHANRNWWTVHNARPISYHSNVCVHVRLVLLPPPSLLLLMLMFSFFLFASIWSAVVVVLSMYVCVSCCVNVRTFEWRALEFAYTCAYVCVPFSFHLVLSSFEFRPFVCSLLYRCAYWVCVCGCAVCTEWHGKCMTDLPHVLVCVCSCEFNVRVVKIYACKGEVVSERASEPLTAYVCVRACKCDWWKESKISRSHTWQREGMRAFF